MSFLSPLFLIAISAVGLPLIIHLLNLRRPQRVKFSTLAFFKELQKTTIRKIRIKRYLLLLLRLLAIACLALVLARPFLPPGIGSSVNSQAPSLNAILIDNSISMSRIGSKGPLIEQAKEVVKSIEESSKESDRFVLQVTNGEAQYNTIVGHGQLLRRIEELEVSNSGNYSNKRIIELQQILEDAPYENKRLFVISDGQRSQVSNSEISENENRSLTSTYINLGEVEIQNTVITELESSTNMIGVGLPVNLSVKVQNKGEVPVANQFISLEFQERLVGQYSVSLDAGSSKTFSFEVTPTGIGSSKGKVFIEGDEFSADNEYFFSIDVPETRRILWVKEPSSNTVLTSYTGVMLEASGNNDAQINYENAGVEILGTNDISQFDAIILDGIKSVPEFSFNNLLNFIQSGKGVIFFPSETGDIRNYNEFLRLFNVGTFEGVLGEYSSFKSIAKGGALQEDHPIFIGLFDREETENLRISNPDIYYYYKLKPSTSPGGFNILLLNNEDPLIREKRFGDGRMIVSAIGNNPGWSNFAVKPLYAPFYYRTLLYAASSDEGGFSNHTLGNIFDWTGSIDAEGTVINVNDETVIPEVRVTAIGTNITYPAENWTPGWVTVSDAERVFSVGVNLERKESDFAQINNEEQLDGFAYVDASELGGESLENEIKASGFGKEIWSWFMLAGLLFLVIESLVSIFYKAETIS
tara:strand:+ start:82404 stop:84497 length:2094 start_codon:yes stop_codon:yes gene_type:complete